MVFARFAFMLLMGATAVQAHAQSTSKPAAPARKPAAAQPARPQPAAPPVGGIKPEERARQMTASMTQALGLTPDQSKRVQQINQQSIERVEEARRTFARQLSQMAAEVDKIGQSRLSLLKDVLTEQQFRSYAAMREKKMGIPEALKQQAAMSEAAGGQ
jgi:hypothetical protein